MTLLNKSSKVNPKQICYSWSTDSCNNCSDWNKWKIKKLGRHNLNEAITERSDSDKCYTPYAQQDIGTGSNDPAISLGDEPIEEPSTKPLLSKLSCCMSTILSRHRLPIPASNTNCVMQGHTSGLFDHNSQSEPAFDSCTHISVCACA